MNKISHLCRVMRRNNLLASLCFVLFLLSQQPVRGTTLRAPASSVPVQDKVRVVGILSFQDETDTGAPPELGKKIALQLKQRMSLSFKDVLPKTLSQNSDATSNRRTGCRAGQTKLRPVRGSWRDTGPGSH